jgi:phenylacetate-CoA ligase
MSASDWIARHCTYPAYEWLRCRPTLRELRELTALAARPADAVQAEVQGRLRRLFQFAAQHLPYYAHAFADNGVNPDGEDALAELAKLPVLRKADVRAHAAGMVWRAVPGGPLSCRSGGTSGDTLAFFIDRVRQAQPMAARLFMQGLLGVPVGARRAYLWGAPLESRTTRLKRWRDRLINELLLDAFEMSPVQIDAHLARLRSFQPRVIYGYPSAVALLARQAAERYSPDDFAWLWLVVLTGEEVRPDQVAQIRSALGCPVVSEYGSREVGLIAHECSRGHLHIISPHVLVEVLNDGRPAAPGECGEIVCTTLNTRAQPLIRYALGDCGALAPGSCGCGLPLPLLHLAGGKVTGFIVLADGRLCHGAVTSHVLRDQPGIVEFKTFQRRTDAFEVLLVVDEHFQARTPALVRQRYRALFGDEVQVECRIVDAIPPDPSGKRRYVVSDVAPEQDHFEVVTSAASVNSGRARCCTTH